MRIRKETSYYLPADYHVEQHLGLLALHRSDGSAVDTFNGRQAIGEIVERYAWEDSFKRANSRLGLEEFFWNFVRLQARVDDLEEQVGELQAEPR